MLRYFLLYHFGGVYADLDVQCLRPFEVSSITNEDSSIEYEDSSIDNGNSCINT